MKNKYLLIILLQLVLGSFYTLSANPNYMEPRATIAEDNEPRATIQPDAYVKGKREKRLMRVITSSYERASSHFFIRSTNYLDKGNYGYLDDWNEHSAPEYWAFDKTFSGARQEVNIQEVDEYWWQAQTMAVDYGDKFNYYKADGYQWLRWLQFTQAAIDKVAPGWDRMEFLTEIGGPSYKYDTGCEGTGQQWTSEYNMTRFYRVGNGKTYNLTDKQTDINTFFRASDKQGKLSIYGDFAGKYIKSITFYATAGTIVKFEIPLADDKSTYTILNTKEITCVEGWNTYTFEKENNRFYPLYKKLNDTDPNSVISLYVINGEINGHANRLNQQQKYQVGWRILQNSSATTFYNSDHCMGLEFYEEAPYHQEEKYTWRVPARADILQLIGQAPVKGTSIAERLSHFVLASANDPSKPIKGAKWSNTSGLTLYPIGSRKQGQYDSQDFYNFGGMAALKTADKDFPANSDIFNIINEDVGGLENELKFNDSAHAHQIRLCKAKTDAELGYRLHVDEKNNEVLMTEYKANSDYFMYTQDNMVLNEFRLTNLKDTKRLNIDNNNLKNFTVDVYLKPEYNTPETLPITELMINKRLGRDNVNAAWNFYIGNAFSNSTDVGYYFLEKGYTYYFETSGSNQDYLISYQKLDNDYRKTVSKLGLGDTPKTFEYTANSDQYFYYHARYNTTATLAMKVTRKKINNFQETLTTTTGKFNIPAKYTADNKYYLVLKGIDQNYFFQANLEYEDYSKLDAYTPLPRGMERGIALRYTNREHMKVLRKWSQIKTEANQIKKNIAGHVYEEEEPKEPEPEPEYEQTLTEASGNQNYIIKRTYTKADASRWMDQVQYFDGLGRPNQTVQVGISPESNDLVALQIYDAFGRDNESWLPAVINNNTGRYNIPTDVQDASKASNPNDAAPYSKPVYEASPLNRVLEQYGPGAAWHNDGIAVRTGYLTNKPKDALSLELADSLVCAQLMCTDPLTYTYTKNYDAGELYVTRVTDEDGNRGYEFKNKLGQVVLIRQISDSLLYDTYYVYDDFGNQTAVFPPEASQLIYNNKSQLIGLSDAREKLAYLYKYDNRNRCIWKKLPGADSISYIYDKADRLIFSQDGEQRERDEWSFVIPDVFGRVALLGIIKDKNIKAGMWSKASEAPVVKAEYNKGAANFGYTITAGGFTITPTQVLTANFYDSYDFIAGNALTGVANNLNYVPEEGYDAKYDNAKGMLAGSMIAIIDETGVTTKTYSAVYYDYRGRVIQTQSLNHLGGKESEYLALNFIGQPQKTKQVHTNPKANNETTTEVYNHIYDHAGRLKDTYHQLNKGSHILIASNNYDDQGRLISDKKGDEDDLTTSYTYDIRSRTESMNSTHLGFALEYTSGSNILRQTWKQEDISRSYTFEYDGLSRLTAAIFSGDKTEENFGTSYSYDRHGNIKTMNRQGKKGTEYALVDSLTFTHNGNQLINIKDAIVENAKLEGETDFYSQAGDNGLITYNANGAMESDTHKGIDNMTYNALNLPASITVNSDVLTSGSILTSGNVKYLYSASGAKVQSIHTENTNLRSMALMGTAAYAAGNVSVTTTDYIGNKVYENNKLKRILIPGGYIENEDYFYYLTDHLGNNRAVATDMANIVQRTQYYPFGLPFADAQGRDLQPYTYNGKENDSRLQLNLMDYEARLYNPQYGSIPTMDPLLEKYYSWSPYAYVMNNPINVIDPNGMDTVFINHRGVVDYRTKGEIDIVYVTNNKGKTFSRTYEKGTLKGGGTRHYDGDESNQKYSYLSVNTEENSKDIFEFASEHVDKEIGNSSFRNNKDRTKSHFITSSHDDAVESGFNYLILDEELYIKSSLLKYDHKHPSDIPYPSGLIGGNPGYVGKGDMSLLRLNINAAGPSLPTMRIYIRGKGYIRYNSNSIQSDFRHVQSHMSNPFKNPYIFER